MFELKSKQFFVFLFFSFPPELPHFSIVPFNPFGWRSIKSKRGNLCTCYSTRRRNHEPNKTSVLRNAMAHWFRYCYYCRCESIRSTFFECHEKSFHSLRSLRFFFSPFLFNDFHIVRTEHNVFLLLVLPLLGIPFV